MGEPITIVVFGSTGDLMKRKLLPALLGLSQRGSLGAGSCIIGVGRRPFSDEQFKEFLSSSLTETELAIFERLSVNYFMGDITNAAGLAGLRSVVERSESKTCAGRIFYLATSYEFFPTIISAIEREKVYEFNSGWTRVIFEKPFGNSLASAGTLESGIHKVFSESQVYRIDHYVAKESVRAFLTLKEQCPSLRKVLSRAYVEQIDLIADESVGVADRIEYYEQAGAVKDMIQSHLLQLLALTIGDVAMWSTEALRNAKLRVLQTLQLGSPNEHKLGQYNSYKSEASTFKITDSHAETFACIVVRSTLPAWGGVPFILRTGKKLTHKETSIGIKFRAGNTGTAQLIISLYPEQTIRFDISGKVPDALQSAADEVNTYLRKQPIIESGDGYSFLLERAIAGDGRLFPSQKEIEACWLLVEEFERLRGTIPLVTYEDGSPSEAIGKRI